MNLKLRLLSAIFTLIVVVPVLSKSLPAVPQGAVDEMGVEYGTPRMSGFVFIDGRYIPPPYTVSRRGNGIFINRVQVEQPVPWSYFDPDSGIDPAAGLKNIEEEGKIRDPSETVPSRTPAEIAGTKKKKVSSIDDLFGDADDDNQGAMKEEPEQPKTISSIDDLFGDNDEDVFAAPAPVAKKKGGEVSSLDDLFSDADVPTTQPSMAKSARAPAKRAPVNLTPAELAERKKILKSSLNDQRVFYERAIAKGELYFFGTMHHKINGTYGTARALIEVLPTALRYSRSPAELQLKLQDGGVYFVDIIVCQALYRHKTTFPLLQQRLEKIRLEESIKESNRKKY